MGKFEALEEMEDRDAKRRSTAKVHKENCAWVKDQENRKVSEKKSNREVGEKCFFNLSIHFEGIHMHTNWRSEWLRAARIHVREKMKFRLNRDMFACREIFFKSVGPPDPVERKTRSHVSRNHPKSKVEI